MRALTGEQRRGDIISLRELRSPGDVVHELGLIKNKHITKVESDELFNRIGAALANMTVDYPVHTQVNVCIDDVEHTVSLKRIGNSLALTVTKAA